MKLKTIPEQLKDLGWQETKHPREFRKRDVKLIWWHNDIFEIWGNSNKIFEGTMIELKIRKI